MGQRQRNWGRGRGIGAESEELGQRERNWGRDRGIGLQYVFTSGLLFLNLKSYDFKK